MLEIAAASPDNLPELEGRPEVTSQHVMAMFISHPGWQRGSARKAEKDAKKAADKQAKAEEGADEPKPNLHESKRESQRARALNAEPGVEVETTEEAAVKSQGRRTTCTGGTSHAMQSGRYTAPAKGPKRHKPFGKRSRVLHTKGYAECKSAR